MISSHFVRFIQTGFYPYQVSNKTLLSKLRKKTGYTFANCKKALELHDYDVSLAENWLHKQAQQLGWSKALKLEGRATAQGLVGVAIEKNNAIIVEVNCETDFVARNKNFGSLVEMTAAACLQHANSYAHNAILSQFHLDTERLKDLEGSEGKSLSDHTALMIGKLGENITLRRATGFCSARNILFAGYAHPSSTSPHPVLLGKYGALIAFTSSLQSQDEMPGNMSVMEIGRQLCQHIVGMNPVKIGVREEDTPASDPDEERCMIYQEYLLDPAQTVGEILAGASISLLDFARYECGERLGEPLQNEVKPPTTAEMEG